REFSHEDPFLQLFGSLLRFDLDNAATLPVVVPMAELLLRLFLTGVASSAEAAAPRLPEAVERAIPFIPRHAAEHPDPPLRLPQPWRLVHVTPQHWCRLFKDALGLGPIECAQALRIELASSVLERTELGLADIAERFGFSSQFHFSRAFKQSYGMSP